MTHQQQEQQNGTLQTLPHGGRGICFYCGARAECRDHVIPRYAGGPDVDWNVVPACNACNRSKHAWSISEWLGRLSALWEIYGKPCSGSCRCCAIPKRLAEPPERTPTILSRRTELQAFEQHVTELHAFEQRVISRFARGGNFHVSSPAE